jgi:hypothetical protein
VSEGVKDNRAMSQVLSLLGAGAGHPRISTRGTGESASQLAAAFLAAVLVERSSLGSTRSRELRSQASASDVAAVRNAWLHMPPGGRWNARRRSPGPEAEPAAAEAPASAESAPGNNRDAAGSEYQVPGQELKPDPLNATIEPEFIRELHKLRP